MPFETVLLDDDAQFDELVKCEFISFETPECKLKELFFPSADFTAAARDAAMKEATQRQRAWLHGDPTSRWVLIKDTDTKEIAGAALWHVYDKDPYAVIPDDEECDWFAKGIDRDVANALMEQFLTPRMTYMRKPHAFLDICFTHPDSRRKGVGKLMMEWGTREADKNGYEAYLDATATGRHLYKECGFLEGDKRQFTMPPVEDSERKRQLEEKLIPFEWWPMYRPVNGVYKPGETKLPWE